MAEIDVVFFDIGGVLAPSLERDFYHAITHDSNIAFQEAWKLRNTYWKDISRGHIDEHEYWQEIIQGLDLPYTPRELQEKNREYLHLLDGSVDIVKALATNYRLGIISNHYTPWVEAILEDSGIQHLFEPSFIFISDAEGLRKPDQRLFKRAIETAGVEASKILFIDDNPANTHAAERVGMQTVYVNNLGVLYNTLEQAGLLK